MHAKNKTTKRSGDGRYRYARFNVGRRRGNIGAVFEEAAQPQGNELAAKCHG
jgi:hypothetical protein